MIFSQDLVEKECDRESDWAEQHHQKQHKRRAIVAYGQTVACAQCLRDDPVQWRETTLTVTQAAVFYQANLLSKQ